MILAGVDYSMSCPAIVVGKQGSSFNDLSFYSFAKKKKHMSINKQITLYDYPEYLNEQERYDLVSDVFIQVLLDNKVDKVLMEGYSYGSNAGLVFQIAENTEVFKFKMYKAGIPFEVIPPTQIKKDFTGRGNANKGMMYMTFRDKYCPYDIHNAIGELTEPAEIGNPISDIVDAFAIWAVVNGLQKSITEKIIAPKVKAKRIPKSPKPKTQTDDIVRSKRTIKITT